MDNAAVVYRDVAGFPGYRVGDDGSVVALAGDEQRGRQRAGTRGRDVRSVAAAEAALRRWRRRLTRRGFVA